jgi:hypothetical protein
MAITVKHKFVSAIPDAGDPNIVQPSNWNDTHDLVGTVPVANGGTGAATLTGYVKGNGTANMTASATVPSTDITGLGTMSTQNANAVAVTGGSITGTTVAGYVPTTTSITAGTGLTGGGDLSANRTLAIANTAVTAAAYGSASKTLTATVNAQGQLTSLADTNIAIANTQVSGLGTASTKDAGAALGVATLDSGGKVPISELPAAVLGALSYQGTWDASTNTPTLTSSVGTKGYYYVVSVAGSTNLNGITDWLVGDWAVFNGSVWQKVDNTDAVTSVNTLTGAVVLTTTNIAEGTNEYFTTAKARASVSAGTGISYVSGTGVITNSLPDQVVSLTGAGTTTVTGTYPSFTITSTDSKVGDVVGPASATDNAVARFDTTTGKLIQNSVTLIDDTGNASGILSQQFSNGSAVTLAAGKMWYDGSTGAWNAGMGGGNITQQIGEELFVYGKASAAITDSPLQIVYHTGTVGASGVITFAPTIAGITDENAIIGVATENIALNGFGRVTSFGVVRGITTNGTAFGETWADDDVIWYNPVTGNPTNVKPSAPNIKFQIGLVIKAGSGGSGSFQVALVQGTALGGTDSNVQLSSPTAAQLLTYSTTSGYWKNTSLAAGTGISVGNAASGVVTVTNSAPDQTVALASGTGISVTGTYPSFTVTNTAPSSGGTVTSVSGTTGRITSTGGTTPVLDLTSGIATAGTTGSSTLIPVVTIDTYGRVTGITTAANPQGTVTSVTGTAPVVSSGGATPAISMAAATGSVNGYLTSTDWTTFNNKGSGTVTAVSVASANGFAGTSSGGATPALTLTTSVTGVLKGNGAAISAATSGTDYSAGTSALGTGILKSTTSTGALTIAVAADFPTLNQDTTGTAAKANALNSATTVVNVSSSSAPSAGQVLTATSGTAATWQTPASGGVTTFSAGTTGFTPSSATSGAVTLAGTLALANGGTGQTTANAAYNALSPMTTTGDIEYRNGSSVAARLPIGTTGQVLTVASGVPSWATAAGSNITTLGLYENSATISANYTIGTGNNAMSAGPITVDTGFTVTVPTGSTWTVV